MSEVITYPNLKTEIEESGRYRLLLSEEQIQNRIKELADEISTDYANRCPVLVGVLNGSFIFLADLIRQLSIDCEVDFIKISSYEDALKSSGKVNLMKEIDCDLEGKDVILAEDIVDSGLSVQFLNKKILAMNPASLSFITLLVKWDNAKPNRKIDYVGFSIPPEFVIGYGLDYKQKLRNLKNVYIMQE
ncbi:hypoxanthine phosphoribosyltransferase [candidate division KSB1 bacterium]|nr:hypoxanthine phosphoribosyltransferase [candidate division KSB1 bacterium]